LQEVVSRYEQFVKEHSTFNDGQNKFLEWIAMVEEQLKSLSEIVGDYAVLQVIYFIQLLNSYFNVIN
jgi:hypothetical protein